MTTKREAEFRTTLFWVILAVFAQCIHAESMLERIMTVDDPELGECLRAAIRHTPVPRELKEYTSRSAEYRKAKLEYDAKKIEVARAVTESYAQIKLLDSQIEQIDSRLSKSPSGNLPSALGHELILARAELESKRLQEFAKLREAIGIIPRHAFGEIQLGQLKTWVTLDVLNNEHVLVFEMETPFVEDRRYQKFEYVNDMSHDKAIAYILETLSQPAKQPLRIDIFRRQGSVTLSDKLHGQLEKMAQGRSLEMDTDIRLISDIQHGSEIYYYHIKDRIANSYGYGTIHGKRQYNLRNHSLDAKALKEDIMRALLAKPVTLPIRFTLEHDEAGLESAKKTAATVKELAQEHHLSEFTTVVLVPTKRNWNSAREEN